MEPDHGLPDPAGHRAEEAHAQQEYHNAKDDEVQQLVYRGPLQLRLARVLHELGVLAREQHHAVAPGRVAQHRAAVDHLLIVQGKLLTVVSQRPLELGQVVVGRLADDVAVELGQRLLVLAQHIRHIQTLLHLQVGLPVQLGRLDVDQTVGVEGGEQQDVRGDEAVVLHADDVPDLDPVPLLLHQVALPQHLGLPVVDLTICFVSILEYGE